MLRILAASCLSLLLSGCSLTPTAAPSSSKGMPISGRVHGGQQPIVGAHVYLFAAGTTGYGGSGIAASASNASTSLLNSAITLHSDSVGAYVLTAADGSFSITGDYICTPNTQVYLYALGGDPGAGVNSASGLLAALGNCPATTNFLTSAPTIWINEVSTVAAAFAFAAFASDATHVSSSGTTLAQTGIANAFASATNLASIATGTALAVTPGNVNSTAPQTTVNTVANILASCVNSTDPASTQCSTLFSNALSGGTTGTQPTDTATAAINIAHFPGINVVNLYSLSAPTVAFAPKLSVRPNDFALSLTFTNFGLPDFLAVDAAGNIWIPDFSKNVVVKLSNLGVQAAGSPFSTGASSKPFAIAIDSSGNAWVANQGNSSVTEFSASGIASPLSPITGGISAPLGIAVDASDNVWVANSGTSSITELSNLGAPISAGITGGGLNFPFGISIDHAGNIWVSNFGGVNSGVSRFSSAGVPSAGSPFTSPHMHAPKHFCIDNSQTIWVPSDGAFYLSDFTDAGALITEYPTNNVLSSDCVVDGANYIWTPDSSSNSLYQQHLDPVTPTLLTGFVYFNSPNLHSPTAVVVDGSGNVWASNSSLYITEFIGLGAPTITPLSAGVKNHTLGTRP